MTMDPAQVTALAERVASLYADSDTYLVGLIAEYTSAGIGTPQWVTTQRARTAKFSAVAKQALNNLAPQTAASIREAVLAAADIGDQAAQADLAARLPDAVVRNGRRFDPASIHALAEEATGIVTGTHPAILRSANDIYRQVVTEVSGRALTGVVSQRQALQQALDRFAAEGVSGFTDSRGRRWHMDTYAEMAVRTATARALNVGHTQRLISAGHDLVVISAHPRPAPECARFENRLVSLTGKTPNGPVTVTVGKKTVTETVVASMAQAEAEGLHHHNCRHRHSLWKPGKPLPDPPADDAQGYRDEQRLRGLERASRAQRRKLAAAVTPAAKQAATDRLAAIEDRIDAHVKATGVPRRRYREQLREGNAANAITPVEVKTPKPEAAPETAAKPAKAKPKPPEPSEMTDAQLAKAIAAAEKKVAGLKKPNSLLAMPAHAQLTLLRHELRRRDPDADHAPTELEARAAALVAQLGAKTPEAKIALSEAKIAMRDQMLADQNAFADWLAAEAAHGQQVADWLAAEAQYNTDVTEWLAAAAKYTADVDAWLVAEADHNTTAWLAAEAKWHAEVAAWIKAEKKHTAAVKKWLKAETEHNKAVAAAAAATSAPVTGGSAAAATATATASTTPKAFDAALKKMLAAKTAKDWSAYDPLKTEWAAKLGVSAADLNKAINDITFGGADHAAVKAALAAAKGGPSGSYKPISAPPAPTSTSSAPSSATPAPTEQDVAADPDVVPDPTAPEGSPQNPRHFPRPAQSGHSGWDPARAYCAPWNENNRENLDPVDRAAIGYYTGSGYTPINSALRNSNGKKSLKGKGEDLDRFFETGVTGPNEWVILTRGSGVEQLGLKPGQDPFSVVGKTIAAHGYTSTSIGDEPAFSGTIRMVIRTPPGTKCCYMDGKPGQGKSSRLTSVPNEREVLLAKSTHFKIISVTPRSDQSRWKYDVVCEIVKQGA